MTDLNTVTDAGWLAPEEMDSARERLPILYVDVVPVRVDEQGTVTAVGLLLRAGGDGQIKRALVSGRVLYHERIRAALLRHIEKDLGPLALPRVPPAPQPFTVAKAKEELLVLAEHERVDRQKQAVIARRRAALADVVAGRPVTAEEPVSEPSRMWDTGPIRELAKNAAVRTVRSVRRRPADREPAGV